MTTELLATGWRAQQSGDFAGAEKAYRQAVEHQPENAQGWYLLGALSLKRGDLAAAAASLERALQLRPGFVEALNHRGVACVKLERYAEAADSFRQALSFKPNDAEIQTNLALLLFHQGQIADQLVGLRSKRELVASFDRLKV